MNKVTVSQPLDLQILIPSVADAESIVSFLNEVGGETDFLTFGLNEFPVSVEEEKVIIRECLEMNDCLMLLGKINHQIVSQLFLERSSLPRLSHVGTIGLSVSKQYWRQSIGKRMLECAISWAKNHHVTKLQLAVRADHEGAIRLYKQSGFFLEGTLARAVKINEIYYDNLLMGLIL